MKFNLYKDSIHGIEAVGTSDMMAWGLIARECNMKNLEVPTVDKIQFVRELSEEEMKHLGLN